VASDFLMLPPIDSRRETPFWSLVALAAPVLDCLPFAGVCSKGWFPVEAANLNMSPFGVHLAGANREGCSPRKVNMTLSLAFLGPEIVKAAIEGRLPRGLGISRLSDLPAPWREQFRQLGIAAPVAD
jgi:hypothetical protein